MLMLYKLNFLIHFTLKSLLDNFKLLTKHLKDLRLIIAHRYTAFFIKVQGFIDVLFFLDIVRFSDVFIYVPYFDSLLLNLGCFFCLVSIMCLMYARDTYLGKDIIAFLYCTVLSMGVCLLGLLLIKCGLEQYIVLTMTPPTQPTGDFGPGGNGFGNGYGNGNGNGGTNYDGWGGKHRSDQDEEAYYQRKLAYLESQATKYQLVLDKAKARTAQISHTVLTKRGEDHREILEERDFLKVVQKAGRARSAVVRAWTQALEHKRIYIVFRDKNFPIDFTNSSVFKVSPRPKNGFKIGRRWR